VYAEEGDDEAGEEGECVSHGGGVEAFEEDQGGDHCCGAETDVAVKNLKEFKGNK
jgi:hypothetical protein